MLTQGWPLSRIARLSSGFPVTISSDGDRPLTGSPPNGVNNKSLDLPDFTPGPLHLNHDPRNGLPYFNESLFTPNVFGYAGTASRRSFHRPGMVNFDIALRRSFRPDESRSVEFRLETFNTSTTPSFSVQSR